jgi:hypothetical protein
MLSSSTNEAVYLEHKHRLKTLQNCLAKITEVRV